MRRWQVPAIPESQPLAGDGAPPTLQSPGSEAGSGVATSSGAMLRSGSTAAAEQRAKNIEVHCWRLSWPLPLPIPSVILVQPRTILQLWPPAAYPAEVTVRRCTAGSSTRRWLRSCAVEWSPS